MRDPVAHTRHSSRKARNPRASMPKPSNVGGSVVVKKLLLAACKSGAQLFEVSEDILPQFKRNPH